MKVKTQEQTLQEYRSSQKHGHYDLYPSFPIESGKILNGFDAIAECLIGYRAVILDGYIGVMWEDFRKQLNEALVSKGVSVRWINIEEALLSEIEIDEMVAPFLGKDDPLFGTRFTGGLLDYFDREKLAEFKIDPEVDINIVYGCGAALTGWEEACPVYVDVPKNEIHFRSRNGSISNLGKHEPDDPKKMYKRFYFVDWAVLNQHKQELLPHVSLFIDGQHLQKPAVIYGDDFRSSLSKMSKNYFRARPWFEPGVWGGQWMKEHIPGLPKDTKNYAWSFELITPENGLMLESEGSLLEFSFDCLMYYDHQAVLGDRSDQFGYEFPIRFDYLDTYDGDNLSVQCHPRPEYISKHFGESFTQDETYYILDCKSDAEVYLGFREGVDPNEYRQELERSQKEGLKIDIDRFINKERSQRHDLFLIPNGTVHCSGKNNMVLEISATPYIFTFKMYDWMRKDLDGNPRPLNIPRAMDNLDFDRQGKKRIKEELISHPKLIEQGPDWHLYHLPTHSEHFYDVHRYEFDRSVEGQTDGSCHVLSLVEGQEIELETVNGCKETFHFAETFVIPAKAGSYTLTNKGEGRAKVVKAFLKKQGE